MTIIIIVLGILLYGAIGGITMALINRLYDIDIYELDYVVPFIFLFAPLVLAGIGGYELVMKYLKEE